MLENNVGALVFSDQPYVYFWSTLYSKTVYLYAEVLLSFNFFQVSQCQEVLLPSTIPNAKHACVLQHEAEGPQSLLVASLGTFVIVQYRSLI